jgi:F-type H+-transporting ATPase subunit delta
MNEGGSAAKGEIYQRYAQALLSLAQDSNALDDVSNDVNAIANVLKESADLRAFLTNPLFKADAKKGVLGQVFGEAVHPYTRNFLMLLADRRRSFLLEGICTAFQDLMRKLNQTVLAEVTSVSPLNDDQQEALRQKVIQLTGARQVELVTKQDPDLIGGVIIKIGSQVVDASLRGQLRRISLRLNSVA